MPHMTTRYLLPLVLLTSVCHAADAPKLDTNGDPLPPGAVARLGTIRLRTESESVVSVDGKIIATSGADSSIRLWDAASGSELRRIGWAPVPRRPRPSLPMARPWHLAAAVCLFAFGTSPKARSCAAVRPRRGRSPPCNSRPIAGSCWAPAMMKPSTSGKWPPARSSGTSSISTACSG